MSLQKNVIGPGGEASERYGGLGKLEQAGVNFLSTAVQHFKCYPFWIDIRNLNREKIIRWIWEKEHLPQVDEFIHRGCFSRIDLLNALVYFS